MAQIASWGRIAARAPEGHKARRMSGQELSRAGWPVVDARTGGAGVRSKAEAVRGGGERR